jgi:hypothetical protein
VGFFGGKKKGSGGAPAKAQSGKQQASKSTAKQPVAKAGSGPIAAKGQNSRRVIASKPKPAAPARAAADETVASAPDEIDFAGPPVEEAVAPAPISPGRPDSRSPIKASRPLEGDGDLRAGRAKGPSRSGDAALGEFLTGKAGLVTADQLDQMKAKAAEDNAALDVAGVALGIFTEEQLVNALTQECWVPHLKVDKYEIRKKALDTITSADAVHFGVFPVDKLGSLLTLAMVNPLDLETIRVLESKTSLDIKKVVATRSEIVQGIEKYYSGKAVAKEGSLAITQDVEPKSVTQMLAGVTSAPDRNNSRPSAPMPSISDNAGSEIQDIDDLLAGDDAVAPAIVEPISLNASDIEVIPESAPSAPVIEDISLEETSPVEPVAAAPAAAPDISAFELDDGIPAPAPKATPAKPSTTPEFELDDILADTKPEIEPVAEIPISRPVAKPTPPAPKAPPAFEKPTPAFEKPAPPKAAPAPAPAAPAPAKTEAKRPATSRFTNRFENKPGITNLIPVMEEEFQHAITHGKSHVFDKWVGLQSRNRIINAVVVEREVEPILAAVFASPTLN